MRAIVDALAHLDGHEILHAALRLSHVFTTGSLNLEKQRRLSTIVEPPSSPLSGQENRRDR
jgi:hypothetical protein